MENLSSDLLGPRVLFEFAFNDADFSDRVLHVEIMADSLDSKSDLEGCSNRKRKRDELDKENDSESCTLVEVKTYHISSDILAGHSPFFLKLFKNGMRESGQKDATLRIHQNEEAAVTELLNFMYSNTLEATTPHDLLGVLIAADKFEVTSCMQYCSGLLRNMPMSLEFALLYIELSSSVLAAEVVQPLIDAAKNRLVAHCKNTKVSKEEVMGLPLCAVEVVLGFRSLKVDKEDDVVDFVLEWARAHYPKLEDRREILTKRLAQCIFFSHMSCSKLKEVLDCPDFDHEEVTKLVLEALSLKFEDSQQINLQRPIKVVQFDFSRPRFVVYFDLKKQECENLFRVRSDTLWFKAFHVGGRLFSIYVAFTMVSLDAFSFGLHLFMETNTESCTLDFELAVINKSSKEFQQKYTGKDCISTVKSAFGQSLLFKKPWIDFMSNDSEYFVDGVFHVRADFTINNTVA